MTIAIRSGKFKVRSGAVLAHATLTALIAPIAITTFTALFVWSASAHAGVSIAGTGAAGGMSATDATAIQANRAGGSGHISIIPYYSTQGGNSTLINITNTDLANGKAVKVRFRSAVGGDTVYDFTVLLGPADVWAANVSLGADGYAFLATADRSCTLPANVNGRFSTDMPSYIAFVDPLSESRFTREGYVDVITMSDVPPGSSLFTAINHVNGTAPCAGSAAGATALNALANDPANESAARNLGLNTPTAGLSVTSILINVLDASVAWSAPTTSITAVNASGAPARGRMVFSPQTAAVAPNIDLYTNDPLLRTSAGGGASKIPPEQHHLPDLSTPFVNMGANAVDSPFKYVESVSSVLAVKTLRNEFLVDSSIGARTDWTLVLPTRRYAVGAYYEDSLFVFGPFGTRNTNPAGPSLFFDGADYRGNLVCSYATESGSPTVFDRSGQRVATNSDFVLGVAPPPQTLCHAVTVFSFVGANPASAVLKSAQSGLLDLNLYLPNPQSAKVSSGWAELRASSPQGLPVIGAAFIQVTGPQVAGKSTNFGVTYNHVATP
jgi:hypothetical protein